MAWLIIPFFFVLLLLVLFTLIFFIDWVVQTIFKDMDRARFSMWGFWSSVAIIIIGVSLFFCGYETGKQDTIREIEKAPTTQEA